MGGSTDTGNPIIIEIFHRPLSAKDSSGQCCESQLILTMHDIMQAFDTNQQTDLTKFDLSKAFNIASHMKVVFKLNKYFMNKNINM